MLKLTYDAPITEHIKSGKNERPAPKNSDKSAARADYA